jgi:hypothetical protein
VIVHYILIVAVYMYGGGGAGFQVNNIEFVDKAACETARDWINNGVPHGAECFPQMTIPKDVVPHWSNQ